MHLLQFRADSLGTYVHKCCDARRAVLQINIAAKVIVQQGPKCAATCTTKLTVMAADITCPGEFHCNGSLVSFDIGAAPSYITIISSLFSILGSLLILAAYAQLRDLRTGAQKIITLLALADLVSAAGYIVGSANFLAHFNKDHGCDTFFTLCEIQASFTTWSSICSFFWTVILAVYFYVVMVGNKGTLAAALLPLYNVVAWGIPLLIVVPLAALRKLGYAPYAASNWCFVKDENYSAKLSNSGLTVAIIFLAGKLWEILTYIIVSAIFILIRLHMVKVRHLLKVSVYNQFVQAYD